jgi:hypothetical protein
VGAPARGDVEPLDPHGGRERRRAKTTLAATAAAAGAGIRRRRRRPVNVAAGADQVVEEAELQRRVRRGVALAQQEAGVVHQRVARARRRRPAAQRRPAAATLLAALRERTCLCCERGRAWRQDCFPGSGSGSRHKGGGGYLVEQEGRRAEDEVGAAGVDVDQLLLGPARPRRAEHRLGLPAAAPAARGGLDGQPAHGPGRHPPRAGSRPRLWLPEREREWRREEGGGALALACAFS